jgi:hypothetical protein
MLGPSKRLCQSPVCVFCEDVGLQRERCERPCIPTNSLLRFVTL